MFEDAGSITELLNLALVLIGCVIAIISIFSATVMLLLFQYSTQEKVKFAFVLTGWVTYLGGVVWVYLTRPELLLTFGLVGILPICLIEVWLGVVPKSKVELETRLRVKPDQHSD